MEKSSNKLYIPPAVQRPSVDQLRSVAETLHLHIPTDELEQYRCKPASLGFFDLIISSYTLVLCFPMGLSLRTKERLWKSGAII